MLFLPERQRQTLHGRRRHCVAILFHALLTLQGVPNTFRLYYSRQQTILRIASANRSYSRKAVHGTKNDLSTLATRPEFRAHATAGGCENSGALIWLPPSRSSLPGSLGWYLNGKTLIDINGKKVSVQIGLNLTIVGSKELPGPRSATLRQRCRAPPTE